MNYYILHQTQNFKKLFFKAINLINPTFFSILFVVRYIILLNANYVFYFDVNDLLFIFFAQTYYYKYNYTSVSIMLLR